MKCLHCQHEIEETVPIQTGLWYACLHCGTLIVIGAQNKRHIATREMEAIMRLMHPRCMELVDQLRFSIQERINRT